MLYRIVAFFSALLFTVCSFLGINYDRKGYMLDKDKLEKNISSSQNQLIEEGKLTGSVVIVSQNGETLLNKTYGKVRAEGTEIKADTTFRIASMTKPITAVALLIAYEMELVDIYADVSAYLPQFKDMYLTKTNSNGEAVKDGNGNLIKGEKAKNQIKVYQTVSHVSGLQEVNADFSKYENFTLTEAVDNIAAQPLMFEPGTAQSYCTSGYDIAARIIEIKSGMDYESFLKKYIFDKLGMTDTTFAPSDEQFERMTAIHGRNEDSGKAIDIPVAPGYVFGNFPVSYCAAGAGLISTAGDYMKFCEMLINNGKAPDGTVIVSEESIKLMSTPIPDMKNGIMNGDQQWGLGVRVIVGMNYTLPMGTYGWSGAYGTHFWIDPVNKIFAVYMKNSAYDGGAGAKTAGQLEEDVMNSITLKKLG